MKPAAFGYAKASSLGHALELVGQGEGEARFLAGGQSLVATLNMRLSAPALLVDINGIPGLDTVAREDGTLVLGALTRQSDAERSAEVAAHAPLIAAALPHIAHPAIRNRGTVGGSIAFADPAAELPACLVALDGEVEIAGASGRRRVAAEDFFQGLYETALGPADLLVAVRVPAATGDMRYAFAELCRRHGDYALVGLAAAARGDADGLEDVRLAFFGVGSIPLRARGAEAALAGGRLDAARIGAAVAALDADLDPLDDVQTSAATRRHLAGVLLTRVAGQLTGAAS